MLPTLIKIGPLTIRTYGLFVALGFLAGLRYLVSRAREIDLSENTVYDMVLYAIVSGLLGARLSYVLFNWEFYRLHPVDILRIWEGGLIFYGGFITGALAIVLFVRRHPQVRFWSLADIVAPALALGHFFGRLGCFFAGCCYGEPTTLPWAVTFTNLECLAPQNVPLHPTQLYEAAGNLLIFFGLHRYGRGRHGEGNVFTAYLFLYAFLRFSVEFLRGDERGSFVLGLSPSQLMSVLLALVALVLLLYLRKKHGTTTDKGTIG